METFNIKPEELIDYIDYLQDRPGDPDVRYKGLRLDQHTARIISQIYYGYTKDSNKFVIDLLDNLALLNSSNRDSIKS